jgi:hypothetical protein
MAHKIPMIRASQKQSPPRAEQTPGGAPPEVPSVDRLVAHLKALLESRVSPTGRIPWKEWAESVVGSASALLSAEVVVLLRLDRTTLELRAVANRGLSPEQLGQLRVRPGEGILGRALQTRKKVKREDASGAPVSALAQEGFLTLPYLIVPLWVRARVAGLLVLAQPQSGRFSARDEVIAEVLGWQAGMTLENLELQETVERFYREMVETLSRAIEAKDPITGMHSERTHALVQALAAELHLPSQIVQQIEYGALLHDLGKIGIEDRILFSTEKLSEADYTTMKTHPTIGYRILRPVPFLQAAAAMVLYHQEWFNGTGYPEGLAEEEIPLGARIVAILDAWDAMTSDRPYRKAITKSDAAAELRRFAGTQFDPKLVDLFLRVVERTEQKVA